MFLIRLLSRLPFWILYRISDFLFFVSYYLVGYRRKMVWRNLANSFPHKTNSERKVIEKEFYRNLCDYGVETLKALTISQEELARRIVFTDVRVAEEYKKKHQSMIVLASHQFNWEWLVASANFNFPVPVDYVYQKQNSEFFNNFSTQCRSRFGSYPITRKSVARESIKRKGILRAIAIVADQYPGHKTDKRYQTKFLNQDTVFFYGVNQLAVLMQYPVLFVDIRKVKRGYYEVKFLEIATPPYAKDSDYVIEQYVRYAEKMIEDNPSGWLWSHNRWKKRHLKQAVSQVNDHLKSEQSGKPE
ncbi:MAG TPA: lysophospholipid acyltransferase family protein [Ohtaekwangia sp.]